MSCRTEVHVEELFLSIPIEDFPLKSDLIIGFRFPSMSYQFDEGEYSESHPTRIADAFVWEREMFGVDTGSGWPNELQSLVKKYNGTLVMRENHEDPGEPENA